MLCGRGGCWAGGRVLLLLCHVFSICLPFYLCLETEAVLMRRAGLPLSTCNAARRAVYLDLPCVPAAAPAPSLQPLFFRLACWRHATGLFCLTIRNACWRGNTVCGVAPSTLGRAGLGGVFFAAMGPLSTTCGPLLYVTCLGSSLADATQDGGGRSLAAGGGLRPSLAACWRDSLRRQEEGRGELRHCALCRRCCHAPLAALAALLLESAWRKTSFWRGWEDWQDRLPVPGSHLLPPACLSLSFILSLLSTYPIAFWYIVPSSLETLLLAFFSPPFGGSPGLMRGEQRCLVSRGMAVALYFLRISGGLLPGWAGAGGSCQLPSPLCSSCPTFSLPASSLYAACHWSLQHISLSMPFTATPSVGVTSGRGRLLHTVYGGVIPACSLHYLFFCLAQ